MTVLIAATGSAGDEARAALADAGFDVERVESLSGARERAPRADAVVVGDLRDATASDLRAALRDDGIDTPLVRLGRDEGFEASVAWPGEESALTGAVRAAAATGRYRAAVDELYDRARRRTGGSADWSDADLDGARCRAERAFRDVRRTSGRIPFEDLIGDREGSTDRERDRDTAPGDGEGGDAGSANEEDEGSGSTSAASDDEDAASGREQSGDGCADGSSAGER